MVGRSLKASLDGIERAKIALTDQALSQEKLADGVCDRQTVNKFFTGKAVDRQLFVQICQKLGLNWQEIADLPQTAQSAPTQLEESKPNIAALVNEVRQMIQPYIQEKCGTMKVLDMSQPVGLGDIYTRVNILEKITGRRGLDLAELMQNSSPEHFERVGLGDIREKRIPGLEAVEKFPKLMILGKPGAGKTTFLKHLAILSFLASSQECSSGGSASVNGGRASDMTFPGSAWKRGVREIYILRECQKRDRMSVYLR